MKILQTGVVYCMLQNLSKEVQTLTSKRKIFMVKGKLCSVKTVDGLTRTKRERVPMQLMDLESNKSHI